jgi:hypothetical protein
MSYFTSLLFHYFQYFDILRNVKALRPLQSRVYLAKQNFESRFEALTTMLMNISKQFKSSRNTLMMDAASSPKP